MSKNPDQNIFEGVEYSAKQVSGMPYEAFAKQHKGVLWPNHKDQEAKMQAMHAEATRIHSVNTGGASDEKTVEQAPEAKAIDTAKPAAKGK